MSTSTQLLGDSYTYKPSCYESRLIEGLSLMHTEELFTDVSLVVGDHKFRGHRVVLSASSRYFKAMFMSELSERSKDEVVLHGVSSDTFSSLLQFLYTGMIEITVENCTDLLAAAGMLEISDVITGCSHFLKQHLADDNSIGIYLFADAHACEDLKQTAETYILNNFLKVCQCEEISRLPKDTLIHLLQSENLHIETEFQVFTSAIHWIQHDTIARRKFVFEVMAPVRLPLVPEKQLKEAIENCDDLSLKIALKKIIQDFNPKSKVCLGLGLDKLHLMHPRKSTKKSLFIIGGFTRPKGGRWSDNRTLNTAEEVDLSFKHWRNLPTMQYGRSSHGVALLGRCIYVIGGENNSLICDSVESYDLCFSSDSWVSLPHLISPRSGLGVCVLDEQIYVLGGWVGCEIGDSIECYDSQLSQWQVVGKSITRRANMGIVVHQGLIYVMGGINDLGIELNGLESYNPVTQKWRRLACMSKKRAFLGAAIIGGFIYAVGGLNDYDGALDTVEKYNIEKNYWSKLSPMTVPRAGAGVCAVNQLLYVIGGRSSGSELSAPVTLNSVECYIPLEDSWSEITSMSTGRCELGVVPARSS